MRVKQPEIIFEDDAVIVCRKEAGVAVQTARAGQADMVSLLKNYRAKKKEEPYIGLIHRLDQPVEGVMVFAKTKQAAAKLSVQVSSRSMEKEYLAVTEGIPQPSEGELCDWLLRNGRTNTSQVVEPGTPQAKDAKLRYQVEQTDEEQQKALADTFGTLQEFADYNSAFVELQAGAVDAIAMDIGVAKYQIEKRDNGDDYEILDEHLNSEKYAIGFKKGNTELRDIVDADLDKLLEDGTFDKLAEKYELTDMVCLGQDEEEASSEAESETAAETAEAETESAAE